MSDSHTRIELGVPGMDCPTCADKIEASVRTLAGVHAVEPRVTAGTVSVAYDDDRASAEAVVDRIESAGYAVSAREDTTDGIAENDVWRSSRAKTTAVSALFLVAGLVAEYALAGGPVLSVGTVGVSLADGLFFAAVVMTGPKIVRNGYRSARNANLDMDFLMSVAIVSALLVSLVFGKVLYFEAATLATLFSVSELTERYAMERTRNSLRELMALSPDEARVVRDGESEMVSVEEVGIGDTVRVRPGERLPADGEVTAGESAVDQSPITGESVPVGKTPGETVFAGTIAEEGWLEFAATSEAGDTTLARIVKSVADADGNRTEREQFVERFAGYYTPVMVVVAIAVAVVPPVVLGGDWTHWFVAAITMLVLACPCAFVIATPVSVVSAVTSAAKNGVLIKGGRHLEALGEIEAVAFDKTGTLTTGDLAVTDVIPLNATEEELLGRARGLEAHSGHPIGRAIVARAEENGIDAPETTDFETLTGEGVRADFDGVTRYAGKPELFEELGFDLETVAVAGSSDGAVGGRSAGRHTVDLAAETVSRLQREGKTVILVGGDELDGAIAVADTVRPDAATTVERLHDRGITTVMLTGDNDETARTIAETAGIGEYRAGLLPDEKVDVIGELREEYEDVGMVGDGINDAPALASATVGIAMGAAGTDTALETADIALMGDDIGKLPYAYDLSAATNGAIRQNIAVSLGAKLVLAAGVPLGFVSVALAVLAGDVGMTLGVTGNALRLSRLAPSGEEP